ncbi:SPOR domain-containing protein [Altererythrobacter sp. ZODW24]|uniref:SPOR domain-containing protein n=1 Tax=Altererythrobacter sp. ZODW24 TaxID=2185142 RepID=UPI000DF7E434|nr:SPOR domain-containing protein [Altererythrobacter sp. ZODW24]
MKKLTGIGLGLAAVALAFAAPASADVKAGVDAWSAGDYATAVAEWRGPAAKGDPDAQFNLAQAYRLGRGVDANPAKAEEFYAKAAAQGHIKAADNYGLLLFQSGRRAQALPYVQAAVKRGDPRAQYLLGIAHFNGDMVAKDWVRAYALVSSANTTGLPQAVPAMKQMDEYIPLDQRQMGVALAGKMREEADMTRAREMAAADLGSDGVSVSTPPPPVQTAAATAPLPSPVTRPTAPIVRAPVSPSVAAARAAVAEAARVTGTEPPSTAGADFARPQAAPVQVAAAPAPKPAVRAPAPTPRAAAPKPATSANGPWRVQLGAFGVKSNATRLWSRLSGRPELAGKSRFLVPAGRVTKLQAGGFASRTQANQACSRLKRAGQDCIVTR